MATTSGSGYTIELRQLKGAGSPWIVRVYKKYFLFRSLVSSDWFLDREQAQRFAGQLASKPLDSRAETMLKDRKPGWTLHRAAR